MRNETSLLWGRLKALMDIGCVTDPEMLYGIKKCRTMFLNGDNVLKLNIGRPNPVLR